MTVKIVGSLFIIISCAAFGFGTAASHKKETRMLTTLIRALNYMECDLEYRLTPLPELLASAGKFCTGSLKRFFDDIYGILIANDQTSVQACVNSSIKNVNDLPESCKDALLLLGQTMGTFGLSGQIDGIRSVRAACEQALALKTTDQDKRLRSYQTLGLCAGAALVILFI